MDMSYFNEDSNKGENESHLDSHADTSACGSNMIVLDGTITDYVDVAPFSDEYTPIKDVPIGTCVTAYDSAENGETIILCFGESLYFGNKLKQSLLCPNQMRACGNVVEDTPRQFDRRSKHGITFRDSAEEREFFVPLELDGVISYMNTRKPNNEELQNCKHYWATSGTKPWEPYSKTFEENEQSANDSDDVIRNIAANKSVRFKNVVDMNTDDNDNNDEDGAYNKENLGHDLHCEWLNNLCCSRNLSAIAIAEDGLLLDRMVNNNDVSYLSRSNSGDRNNRPTLITHELNKCVKDAISRNTIRTINSLHTPLLERVAPNGNDIAEALQRDKQCINISAVHQQFNMNNIESYRLGNSRLGTISELTTNNKRPSIDPELLSKTWGIGLQRAKETLKVTTQKGIRNPNSVAKRFVTQPFRNKKSLKGKFFSDTMHFNTTSVQRNEKCAQVTTNGKGFSHFHPIQSKYQASDGLSCFINEYGIMDHLVVDGAKEQGSYDSWKTNWQKLIRKYDIRQTWIQPYCWWQNAAEREIGEIRRDIKAFTHRKGSPKRLWGFLGNFICGKRNRTSLSIPSNMGRTGHEIVTGSTPDITMYVIIGWYDFVYYKDEKDNEQKIGRNLGPAEEFGAGDCYYILALTGKVYVTNTAMKIPAGDTFLPDTKRQMDKFDKSIEEKIGDGIKKSDEKFSGYPDYGDLFAEDEPDMPLEPEALMPEVEEVTAEEYDEYIGAEVLMPSGDGHMKAVVKRRTHNDDGKPVGLKNSNPILDTREYHLEYEDGSTQVYAANLVAENIYAQVDDEGNMFSLMESIIDHKSDGSALKGEDGFYLTKTGNRRKKPTTRGWQLLVQWKDGTTTWIKLADMKESYSLETADYARDNLIDNEPAFAWWVPHVLRKRARVVCGAKTKYWLKTHKYGVRLPKTTKEALQIDIDTGTDFWEKAIQKEMKNVMVAFEFNDEDKIPIAHCALGVHMVFDVKITLQRKARLVADGHKVPQIAKESTYSTVPTRDSIRIFFLIAALNDLDVLSADIQNAYLTAPITEKYWVMAGDEFPLAFRGRPCKVVRALYGLPVAGFSFRSFLSKNLKELGYVPTKGDADVYIRPAVKSNGERYYEYMIAYVDDILCCGENPKLQMEAISKRFTLKDGTVEEPSMYLGADIEKFTIASDPGKIRWAMSSTKYTGKAIEEVERELKVRGLKLPTRVTTPVANGYRPEADCTRELNQEEQNYYQGVIGVLRWICELGRLDILVPVSLLSRYLAQARQGHLQQVYHIFAYLKCYNRSKLVFDDRRPIHEESRFEKCDWAEFYPGAKEIIPPDMPEALGKSVTMTCFVDADHAGCKATRRSHTGVIIYVNKAPILWYSKRQTTVETSTFGSEIVAMKIAIEMVEGLRYKLRMMGINIDGPCDVLCDNESVVKNVTRPESPCKKKHNSVAYHKAREAIAAGIIRVAKEPGETNLADILTKLLAGPTLRFLCGLVMY